MAAPGDTCPPLWGPLSPPKASFIRQGGCLPFWAASSSSFPRLHPSEAAELGHCHGTFLMSGVPSPRASSCPPQPAPCLPAHKLYMPQYWGVSGIQSMNSQIADFCSFSLFTCFCPRAKQLQPPMGWCSGSGGSLAAHSPKGAEFQLFAHDPPSDLLTACLEFRPSQPLWWLSAPLLSQLSHRGVLAGRMEPSWGFLRRLQFQTQCTNCSPRSFVSHQCLH